MTSSRKNLRRNGFTLLELLTVVAIMALLMGATTAAFFGLGRGARMRGSINTLRNAIGLIRQQAILKGQVIDLYLFDDNGVYGYYATNTVHHYQVGETGYFPQGVKVSPLGTFMSFYPAGSEGSSIAAKTITLTETGVTPASSATLKVFPLTGLTKVTY